MGDVVNTNNSNLRNANVLSLKASGADALTVDGFVEAYEQARADDKQVDFREFLPATEHPLFGEIATEMVRVDMEYSWEAALGSESSGKIVADYQRALPDLLADRTVLNEVAFEEYRLRALAGEDVSPNEYHRKYNVESDLWPRVTFSELRAERSDSERQDSVPDQRWEEALTLATDVENFPEIGQKFAGFEIQREIGQGAFSRVYLATQDELSNRPVVLKVGAGDSLEAQHLARLQHTNIVPIYSVHARGNLTAACMPLLGTRTLADLITSLREDIPGQSPQQNLISTFLQRRDETLVATSVPDNAQAAQVSDGPTVVDAVAKASYVNAVVWIIGQLASGLEHAHQRGIIHRDLKPANILLTDEGVPLVLDFNLSEKIVVHGPPSVVVGGTLPYMSPEQLEAMLKGGGLSPSSDVFSLGVLFYELLTGQRPYPDRQGVFEEIVTQALNDRESTATPVNQLNPAIANSLTSVVSRCLEPSAQLRYTSMEELSEDLRRHLEHRPLKYAPDHSLSERVKKWSRRHPRLSSAVSVASLAGILLFILASLLVARGQQVARGQAEEQMRQFNDEMPSLYMAVGMPPSETELLADGITQAHASLDRYGVLDDKRWRERQHYESLGQQQQTELDQRLAEALYLTANATAAMYERVEDPEKRNEYVHQALGLNSISRTLFAPNSAPDSVYEQAARFHKLAGAPEEASRAAAQAKESSQQRSNEDANLRRYADILSYHRNRDYRSAIPLLEELRDLNPDDPVPWLFLGNAKVALGQLRESEGYYTAAIALGPNSHLSYYNRGLSRLDMQQFEAARNDFDRVIAMKPRLTCGYLNRALALRGLDKHQEAIDDLSKALELGATQTRIYFLRSQTRSQVGDKHGAAADRDTGLSLTPTDELSWISRGIAQLKTDPKAALADFRQALELNPSSATALRNCVHVLADQLDQPDQAMKMLNQLLALNAKDANALAGRAVLYARQNNRTAAIADVQTLLKVTKEPQAMFQAACALSLTSVSEPKDVYKALTLLTRAVTSSPSWLARAKTDPDLENLRRTDEYEALLQNWQELTKLNIDLYQKSRRAQAQPPESSESRAKQ